MLDGPALLALFGAECHSLTLNHMSCRRVNLVSRASLEAWFPVGLAQHGRDLQAQPLPHALRTKLVTVTVTFAIIGWDATDTY